MKKSRVGSTLRRVKSEIVSVEAPSAFPAPSTLVRIIVVNQLRHDKVLGILTVIHASYLYLPSPFKACFLEWTLTPQ